MGIFWHTCFNVCSTYFRARGHPKTACYKLLIFRGWKTPAFSTPLIIIFQKQNSRKVVSKCSRIFLSFFAFKLFFSYNFSIRNLKIDFIIKFNVTSVFNWSIEHIFQQLIHQFFDRNCKGKHEASPYQSECTSNSNIQIQKEKVSKYQFQLSSPHFLTLT